MSQWVVMITVSWSCACVLVARLPAPTFASRSACARASLASRSATMPSRSCSARACFSTVDSPGPRPPRFM